jgi:hypothetical protein
MSENTAITKFDESHLPARLEDLARFVLVGREKLVAVRALIRAESHLDIASGVREQKKGEAQMLAEALLDAEVRIGELTREIPGSSGRQKEKTDSAVVLCARPTKAATIERLGLAPKQVERFESLAAHPEIVEQVKAEARENDDLATRSDVLRRVKELRSEEVAIERRAMPVELFLYNIWNIQGGDDKEHFGHFPYRFMYNLLYYHAESKQTIYDPFAGSGTTADACKALGMDSYCSDLNPKKDFIRKWDIADGLPDDLPDIDLAFLDPPYWIQAEGKYSNSDNDLGNMDLDAFNLKMRELLRALSKSNVTKIAIVIQPTQYKNKFVWTDHIFDFYSMLPGYIIEMRYILPYSTQQYNAQMVEKAKAERKCLGLNRDLVVWRRHD